MLFAQKGSANSRKVFNSKIFPHFEIKFSCNSNDLSTTSNLTLWNNPDKSKLMFKEKKSTNQLSGSKPQSMTSRGPTKPRSLSRRSGGGASGQCGGERGGGRVCSCRSLFLSSYQEDVFFSAPQGRPQHGEYSGDGGPDTQGGTDDIGRGECLFFFSPFL